MKIESPIKVKVETTPVTGPANAEATAQPGRPLVISLHSFIYNSKTTRARIGGWGTGKLHWPKWA